MLQRQGRQLRFIRRLLRLQDQLAVQVEKHTHKALSTKTGFRSCSAFGLIHDSPLSTKQANELGFQVWQKDPLGEVGIQNDERMRW